MLQVVNISQHPDPLDWLSPSLKAANQFTFGQSNICSLYWEHWDCVHRDKKLTFTFLLFSQWCILSRWTTSVFIGSLFSLCCHSIIDAAFNLLTLLKASKEILSLSSLVPFNQQERSYVVCLWMVCHGAHNALCSITWLSSHHMELPGDQLSAQLSVGQPVTGKFSKPPNKSIMRQCLQQLVWL